MGRSHSTRAPVIAIVGGGFSGTATAIALLRGAEPGTRLVLVERGGEAGAGIAYGSRDPQHRLNVAAARMSAISGASDDLIRWSGATASAFLPRRVYAEYLRARLAEAIAGSAARLEPIAGEVVRLRPARDAVELRLADGRALACDRAVLAVGWPPGRPAIDLPDDPRAIPDPWAPGALDEIPQGGSYVLIGTGPTAVDVALTATARPDVHVTAVSRHGWLPFRHLPGLRTPAPLPALGSGPLQLDELEARVRRHAVELEAFAFDWRDVVDGIRLRASEIWMRLPADDRRRFLAERIRAWEVRRHRLAPEVASRLDALRSQRRLRVIASRVTTVRRAGSRLDVVLSDGRRLPADRVIACTGAGTSVTATTDPLIRDLLATGLAAEDELGIGLRTTRDGALLDRSARRQERIWTLGPLRRGELWESISVPELREQAATVGEAVLRSLAGSALVIGT